MIRIIVSFVSLYPADRSPESRSFRKPQQHWRLRHSFDIATPFLDAYIVPYLRGIELSSKQVHHPYFRALRSGTLFSLLTNYSTSFLQQCLEILSAPIIGPSRSGPPSP